MVCIFICHYYYSTYTATHTHAMCIHLFKTYQKLGGTPLWILKWYHLYVRVNLCIALRGRGPTEKSPISAV